MASSLVEQALTEVESINTESDLLGYKCSSCLTTHNNEENYNLHYKSDFHRFNVKRKMAEFNPVSWEQFEKWQKDSQQKTKLKPLPTTFYCETCHKKFTNNGTLQQHLATKKHQQEVAKKEIIKPNRKASSSRKNSEVERGDPTEDNTACLFCNL